MAGENHLGVWEDYMGMMEVDLPWQERHERIRGLLEVDHKQPLYRGGRILFI